MPTRKEFRIGDAERDDLSKVATVATLQIAPVPPNDDWRLTITVEDEVGPTIPDEGAEAEEEEIDMTAFYDEFIRSGRGNATVVAEAGRHRRFRAWRASGRRPCPDRHYSYRRRGGELVGRSLIERRLEPPYFKLLAGIAEQGQTFL